MKLSTQHFLHLLLIIIMGLAPLQSAFSMQMGTHNDSPVIVASDQAHSVEMKMFDEDSKKHDDCGNCQGSTHCNSCPMTLAIFLITPIRYEMGTQYHVAISDVSFNSTDLLPDYRPPRFF